MQKSLIRNSHHLLISTALMLASSSAFAGSNEESFPWFVVLVFLGAPAILIFVKMRQDINLAKIHQKEQEISDRETAELATKFIADTYGKMLSIIDQHLPALAVKQQQLMTKDAYGVVDVSAFLKEVDYFIEKVLSAEQDVRSYLGGVDSGNIDAVYSAITAQLNAINEKHSKGDSAKSELDKVNAKFDLIKSISAGRIEATKQTIYKLVSEYRNIQTENQVGQAVDVESLDPIQFEHHCADLLNATGWNARVTQASGDQGIDVIAQHGNVKAVFQCKKYSQPVGNAAVQEIIAGKAFEQAHVAAVVTNATYTPSAKQLASTTGVHLLHFSEVPQFAEKLGLVESV
jgi:restriction system protein